MKLLTKELLNAFKKQGDTRMKESEDIKIICKFFNPCGAATWWCFEYDEENEIFMCVADLGFDCREIGGLSLKEMKEVKLPFGLRIERDRWFPIGEYSVAEALNREWRR